MRNSLEVFFHFRLGLAHFSQQVICLLEMCENSYLKRFCWKKRQKELGKFCHWCVKKIFHTAKTTNKFFLTTKEWNTFQHSTYPVENDNWKFQLLFVAQAKCVRKKKYFRGGRVSKLQHGDSTRSVETWGLGERQGCSVTIRRNTPKDENFFM